MAQDYNFNSVHLQNTIISWMFLKTNPSEMF